jgi:hypothetical protein
MQWWEISGNIEWLNKGSRVWQNVEENLIKEIKQRTKPELEEIKRNGIRFNQQNIEPLSDILQRNRFVNIITNTNSGSLSKLKTSQSLKFHTQQKPRRQPSIHKSWH